MISKLIISFGWTPIVFFLIVLFIHRINVKAKRMGYREEQWDDENDKG
jgi:hypothetical protein